MNTLTLLAQSNGGAEAGGLIGMLFFLIQIAVILLWIVGGWKMFQKADQPGWGVLIPFYNLYLMIIIAGRPGWWFFLAFIPVVNLVINFIIMKDIAERFGKDIGFAIGLFFLPFIFIPILGFGSAEYRAH
jgi:hypothetical protein